MYETSIDRTSAALDYEELLARCMGNIEFAERVLDKFQSSFGQELENLENGLNSENAETVTMIAHRLKGASASVGAPGLRQWAAEIEQLGRADRLNEAQQPAQHLRDEWSRFLDHVSSGLLRRNNDV
jgi:HPt (histidine-containing phosphotransfer) domain-containing protein